MREVAGRSRVRLPSFQANHGSPPETERRSILRSPLVPGSATKLMHDSSPLRPGFSWVSVGLAVACLADVVDCQVPTMDWMAARRPMLRPNHAPMVYDLARARSVLFSFDEQVRSMTWEMVGDHWVRRETVTSPPRRQYHAMAYDAVRRCCVLFGGVDMVDRDLGDTWEYDGVDWGQRIPTANPPPTRGPAMAYDLQRQRTVLFGGRSGLTDQQATWEWDGAQWSLRTPAAAPGARVFHSMCYDVHRHRTVVVGGMNNSNPLNDTWEWDGTSWSLVSGNSPPGYDRAMVYDFHRARSVLFGGGSGGVSDETWEWDGVVWTSRMPSARPPARMAHAMAYDIDRQRAVVCGGYRADDPNDTWSWDGTSWLQLHRDTAQPRLGFWSASRQRVVGITSDAAAVREWDGLSWFELPTSVSPPPRFGLAASFDSVRQRIVLFGGRSSFYVTLDDTWEWDGVNWSMQTPISRPAGRFDHAMAFDPNRQRTVLYSGGVFWGGSGLPETWEWDGSNWVQPPTATSPGHRRGATMAFDPVRQEVLLFGGTTGVAAYPRTTWSWNGQRWLQLTPASTPNGREAASLAFDENLQRLVLSAGYAYVLPVPYASAVTDAWQWDGSQWSPLVTPTPSFATDEPVSLVYDHAHQRMHMLGEQHWLLGPLQRAVVQATGSGCGGATGVPVLTAAVPHLGSLACPVDLLRARALAPAMLVLSLQARATWLGSGCTLYIGPPAATFLSSTNASGSASTTLVIPADPALRAVSIYAQAAVLDAGAPFGVSLSQGLELFVGD